jgi:hypothetical protein
LNFSQPHEIFNFTAGVSDEMVQQVVELILFRDGAGFTVRPLKKHRRLSIFENNIAIGVSWRNFFRISVSRSSSVSLLSQYPQSNRRESLSVPSGRTVLPAVVDSQAPVQASDCAAGHIHSAAY